MTHAYWATTNFWDESARLWTGGGIAVDKRAENKTKEHCRSVANIVVLLFKVEHVDEAMRDQTPGLLGTVHFIDY